MIFQDELSPDELIPVITQVFLEISNNSSVETHIQKILFELKAQLSNDVYIQRILPFYWYRVGPFSEVVAQTLDIMEHRKILLRDEKAEDLLVLNLENVPKYMLGQDIIDKIKSILKTFKFYDFSTFLEQIYRKRKPYKFIPLFNFDFLKTLEIYVENLVDVGQKTLGEFSEIPSSPYLDKLENVLYDCQKHIPSNPLFNEFRDLFTSFMIDAITVFDYTKEFGSNRNLYHYLLTTTREVWYTFAAGVRILPKAHNSYYKRNIPKWRIEFSESMIQLSTKLDAFTLDVVDNISYDDSNDFQDEESRRIISAVVDEYSR